MFARYMHYFLFFTFKSSNQGGGGYHRVHVVFPVIYTFFLQNSGHKFFYKFVQGGFNSKICLNILENQKRRSVYASAQSNQHFIVRCRAKDLNYVTSLTRCSVEQAGEGRFSRGESHIFSVSLFSVVSIFGQH